MRELSLHILDIVQNSVSAGASLIQIVIVEDTKADRMSIDIIDNGRGMTRTQVSKVSDPFFTSRTTRKVGLGIPLFKMAAEQAGGDFSIESIPGKGTTVKATFGLTHIDRAPLGNMIATVNVLIRCNPKIDFIYRREKDGRSFTLDTREVREELGAEVPLDTPEVLEWVDGYLKENTEQIVGGA
nr:ATP-binding protein [uncultured Solibaculum sp.]